MKVPPVVLHRNTKETDNREELVTLCGKAMHLSKGAINLLYFYSSQTSGFRPSLQLIQQDTCMSKMGVWKARTMLCENGICSLQDNKLVIDWERIRLFGTLDPKKTSKHAYVAPVTFRSGAVATLEEMYKQSNFSEVSLDDLASLFSMLTDEEWKTLSRYIHSHSNYQTSFSMFSDEADTFKLDIEHDAPFVADHNLSKFFDKSTIEQWVNS